MRASPAWTAPVPFVAHPSLHPHGSSSGSAPCGADGQTWGCVRVAQPRSAAWANSMSCLPGELAAVASPASILSQGLIGTEQRWGGLSTLRGCSSGWEPEDNSDRRDPTASPCPTGAALRGLVGGMRWAQGWEAAVGTHRCLLGLGNSQTSQSFGGKGTIPENTQQMGEWIDCKYQKK